MRDFIRMTVLAAWLLVPVAGFAAGSNYSGGGSLSGAEPRTPESQAIDAYNYGLEFRDKAWDYEHEAESVQDDKKKNKLLEKAQKAHLKAIKQFEKAVDYNPRMFQAWSSMGYALRKTGDYEKSLQAYQQALTLNPKYHEAIEYQAEAHLHLGQYEKVKTAYARLAKEHPEYAGQLMAAINKWLPTQDLNSNAELKAFAAWAGQQQ